MNQTFKKYNLLLGWIFHLVLSFFFILFLAYLTIQSWPQKIEKELVSHDITLAHLRNLSHQIRNNHAAERMQNLFPEGACFTLTLCGLAWGNTLPHLSDTDKQEALTEIIYTLNEQNGPSSTSPFVNTEVRNGVFWLGQRNLLLGVYLHALDEKDRPENLVQEFHTNSKELAEAFHKSPTHHLDAYPSMCWPADNVTALRSTVLHDELYGTDYRTAYEAWKE